VKKKAPPPQPWLDEPVNFSWPDGFNIAQALVNRWLKDAHGKDNDKVQKEIEATFLRYLAQTLPQKWTDDDWHTIKILTRRIISGTSLTKFLQSLKSLSLRFSM
jgi:hypothetical protein